MLLLFPVMFPQTTVCTANTHALPSVGTSVQVTVVYFVVVGQLPQFDARMLYWISEQFKNDELQVNTWSSEPCTELLIVGKFI